MEEIYSELGLSINEGKVYQILVEHGKLGAGEISGRSGVSYSKIYNVLDSLILKGLVKVIPEKSKKFVPSDPDTLIKLIEEKEKKFAEAKEKAKKMKEFYNVKEKNPVLMALGKKGFYKVVKEGKSPEKYGYSIKWTSEYNPEWAERMKKRLRKKIDVRVLTRYDQETENDVKKWLKINHNIKRFDNNGVAISITDDEEVMLGLIKSNCTLLIKDKPFARIMRQLFLDSYERAKKLE